MMTSDKRMALIVAQPGPLRDGLKALLMTVPQIETVMQVSDVSSVRAAIAQDRPVLVLLDTNFTNGNGPSTVVKLIKAEGSQSRCLVLADNIQQQQQAKAAGADVVLFKGFPAVRLFETIEELLSKPEAV